MSRPHRLGEQLLRIMRGLVPVHQDLLPDDVPFAFDLLLREDRIQKHIAEDICHHRQLFGPGLRIKTSMIFGREGIDKSAQALNFFGDVLGRPALGAFEQEMLQEMRDPAQLRGFVPASHTHPDANTHAFHWRHFSRSDSNAVC